MQLFLIAIFIFSVIIHEVSHGYVAYLQGDNTAKYAGRLTLNPISHIDMFGSIILPLILVLSGSPMIVGWAKPVPFNPYNLRNHRWGEMFVALAGPLSNICIGVVFGLIIRFGFFATLSNPFQYIVWINLILATFNLVPIPPLDGSKILFSVLPYSMQNIRTFLERNQMIIIIFFIFFLWSYIIPVVNFEFTLLTGILA